MNKSKTIPKARSTRWGNSAVRLNSKLPIGGKEIPPTDHHGVPTFGFHGQVVTVGKEILLASKSALITQANTTFPMRFAMEKNQNNLSLLNASVVELYKCCLPASYYNTETLINLEVPANWKYALRFIARKDINANSAASDEILWRHKNAFCCELTFTKHYTEDIEEILLEELNRYFKKFDLSGTYVIVPVKCFVVRKNKEGQSPISAAINADIAQTIKLPQSIGNSILGKKLNDLLHPRPVLCLCDINNKAMDLELKANMHLSKIRDVLKTVKLIIEPVTLPFLTITIHKV